MHRRKWRAGPGPARCSARGVNIGSLQSISALRLEFLPELLSLPLTWKAWGSGSLGGLRTGMKREV